MTPSKLLDRVPAQWPVGDHCKIAFVGEAPSDYERLYGYPLVGPAGRTFDQILRIAGLACGGDGYGVQPRAKRVSRLIQARADFLVTNVFDEQLPGNDIGAWCAASPEMKTWEHGYALSGLKSKSGKLGYLRPEHLHHLSRLREELERASPNLIVPLGATALWALTGVCDITVTRGTVSSCSALVPGVKMLPTYHPAHVQQAWQLFHVVVGDLVKAQHEAEFPEVRLAKRRIHIRPTSRDLPRWEQILLAADRLAVDIETSKQQITCIGFSTSSSEAYVVPFVDYEQPSRSYWPSVAEEVAAWLMVRRVCESAIPKTLQNGLYDAYYLIRQANIWPMNYDADTRLQHHALYPELPKSLAFMGATYGTQGPWKLMASHRREKKDD